MPDPMPFTAKDADIWFETLDKAPGLCYVLCGSMRGCSFRAARLVAGFDLDFFDVSSMGSTISRFVYLITKQIGSLKIYV